VKNCSRAGLQQITIWRVRIAYWIPKATNTHSEYVIFIFLCNNAYTNATYSYVILRCLPCFLQGLSFINC